MYQKCPICNGEGTVRTPFGSIECPTCNGQRIINESTGLPPQKKEKEEGRQISEELLDKLKKLKEEMNRFERCPQKEDPNVISDQDVDDIILKETKQSITEQSLKLKEIYQFFNWLDEQMKDYTPNNFRYKVKPKGTSRNITEMFDYWYMNEL